MKHLFPFIIILFMISFEAASQDTRVGPTYTVTGTFLGETPPLRDLPPITAEEYARMEQRAKHKMLNAGLKKRTYPYAEMALPQGPDPVWQRHLPATRDVVEPIVNFNAQSSPYYPPDCNGAPGPNHFVQTVNATYTIYDKTGTLLAGPAAINTLFTGLPGAQYNNGDPIILYDEQADRWMLSEFSVSGANDYMLVAVSTTNDPTGTWYSYSFDVADMPDYMKFGVWQDGYYMATNNAGAADIYVFERAQMLTGGAAQMMAFDNPNRPVTWDNFMVTPPVDNQGTFAPAGSPALFIALNDDATGGGTDQIWIYELDADWANTANSTFGRVQQINVEPFDSNFGSSWDNIAQPDPTKKLDAIPMIMMNAPVYRNFGTHQTIVCCHTVDVDATDHAGIRWYELRKTGTTWAIRQQSTYAPDAHSRWMGSITMNGNQEIGLGFSISSSTLHPGIRFSGQTSTAHAQAADTLDVGEGIIQTGTYSQTVYNRWGDYSSLQVDPANDEIFWYTSQYVGTSDSRRTKVASFQIGPATVTANFSASNTTPNLGAQVDFTTLCGGEPTSFSWTFSPSTVTYLNGTSATSQNPQVSFDSYGYYAVTLYATDGITNDTETKTAYIFAYTPGIWLGAASGNWNDPANWQGGIIPDATMTAVIPPSATNWPAFTSDFTVGVNCNSLTFDSSSDMQVSGNFTINQGKSLDMTDGGILRLTGDFVNNGTFIPGGGTIEFNGAGNPAVVAPAPAVSNYVLSTFTKGMTALSGGTAGPGGNDAMAGNVPIGFTFSFAGTDYTEIKFCNNGWISLDESQGTINTNNAYLFSTALPNTTLAPWWDDLYDNGSSYTYYKTDGTAPNRVFTGEWNRVYCFNGSSYARISFQVKLFETTNVIEFHYGEAEAGTHSASEGASIGIEDATGGSGHFIEATTGSTTAGVTTLKSETQWPAVNYRFTPPAPAVTFNNLSINKTSGLLNFDASAVLNGSFTISPGSSFVLPTDKTIHINGIQ